MIGNEFQKLSESVNGSLTKYGGKYGGEIGSFLHTSRYILTYEYKNCQVTIENSLGLDNMGNIELLVPIPQKDFQFEVKTRSIISQVWNRKKPPLEVFSKNNALKEWIEANSAFKQLCDRARKDRFEPAISVTNRTEGLHIKCRYHLVFNNYELTIAPFSTFFNDLIDFIQKGLQH